MRVEPPRCGESVQLVLTCEHGGHSIPPEFQTAFRTARKILKSHRGWDPGALELAERIAAECGAPLEFETISRLLIELNRTLGHPRVFSEFSKTLAESQRQGLIETIYLPYRSRVREMIRSRIQTGPVLHLSIHSFTPIMNGKIRGTDIGLLFDPSREFEQRTARLWKREIQTRLPECHVHFNRPYRGTSDGFTVALRKEFNDHDYAGLELEVNQKFPLGDRRRWDEIQKSLAASIAELLNQP